MNLGGSQTVSKAMSAPSSNVSRKAGDGISDQFPAGLRVLVVDDDPTCLRILEKMLRACLYEVTKCNRAEVALSLLRENRKGYDIVISDVHMPDMDGFELLAQVGLEMDLPVIMMSADDSKNVVMKGVTYGACDYLIKPVRIEALKNIWQHVVRKRKYEWKDKDIEQSGSVEDGERLQKPSEDVDYSSANEGNWKSSRKRKDEEEEAEERDDSSTLKKPRVVWSVELHQQFVAAVNQLGIDKAVPKKILELMNVPGLTRENVASHLQKYRMYLKRISGVPQHQGGLNNAFMGPSDAPFGTMSSVNGLDLQALAASGQLPAQNLATLQAAALGRSTTKSPISMPLLDQRNIFSFETPRLRFGDVHQQVNNNSRQMNLLHGIPTNMEPKQLANLHSAQPFAGMNVNSQVPQGSSLLMQMTQQQSRPQLLNETNGSQLPRIQSAIGHNIMSNAIPSGVLAPKGMVENVRGTAYGTVSQASSVVDFTINQNSEMRGNSFPIMSHSGMSNFTSKGLLQEASLEVKESRGYMPNYELFNELNQHKPQDLGLQDMRTTLDVSQKSPVQGNMSVSQSVQLQQGFSSSQKAVQNKNAPIGKAVLYGGEGGQSHTSNMVQQPNLFLVDSSLRVKAERKLDLGCQNSFFPEQFGQEDLMSALLKQQPEGIGPLDNEFGFDGYPLDDLPV